jgi:hypothetical protein
MNQHIEAAEEHIRSIMDCGLEGQTGMLVATLSIAESLLSIAKSMHAMELEDARIQRNADEWNEMCEQEEEVEHYRKVAQ